MERFIENAMYASRWLLAPIYFGLSLGLLALALKFFQEVFHVIPNVFSMAESDLILVLLSLIDMALVGGLLVMVMISGYENFVSQLDIDESKEKLNWLGTMDSSSLKMKVAASIVAISSIHLLRIFMDAKNVDPEHLSVADNIAFGIRKHPNKDRVTEELLEQGKDLRPRGRAAGTGLPGPGPVPGPLSQGAFRRTAAARGRGPCAGGGSARAADG